MNFNAEEINLIAAFDMGNRRDTLEMMEDMLTLLGAVAKKVGDMTDEDYAGLDLSPAGEELDAPGQL